ncbi:unnamed protein product [Clonostachys rhizophaga]|uniref:Rhodopsin domain-containing protein n=1 Tax=Clonostachys rhizophaga TaxID=160324 RepID=A0A9N9YC29_9HYPO|nr:unnamed protein product [Clonostachys rhizophaga]
MSTIEELATKPAMPAPDGQETDFNQHTEYPNILLGSFVVSYFLATLFLALRLYTTSAIVRRFDLDDGLIILAWGLSGAYCIIMCICRKLFEGDYRLETTSKISNMDYANRLDLKLLGPSMMTYSWSVSIAKLAMLALYHRINTDLMYRIAIYATTLSIFGYQIAFTYLFTGPCEPANSGAGECLNKGAIAQVILNIAFDIIVILIPIPTIMSLKMPRKQRGLVIMILGLGSGAAVVSAVKVWWVMKMIDNPDMTYTQGQATILTIWEANVSIWCNNLVRLKPFIRRNMPRLYALIDSTGKYGNNYGGNSRSAAAATASGLRPWEKGRKDASNCELSAIRKGGIPLGSSSDLTNGNPEWITVTTDYAVDVEDGKANSTNGAEAQSKSFISR